MCRWDREQAARTETTSLEAPIQSAAEAEAFVRDTCSELLKRGKRFCNKELEITHKQLIREQRQFGGKKFAPLVVDAIAEDKARAVAILQERRLKRKSASGRMPRALQVEYQPCCRCAGYRTANGVHSLSCFFGGGSPI